MSSLNEIEKEQLKILVDEYKTLAQGIYQRVDLQQRLLNFHLIFLAVLAALIGRHPSYINTEDALLLLLIIPIILMFFVWGHNNHDAMIIAYAEYINQKLRPKIENLLQGKKVLEFESFLQEYRENRYPSNIHGVLTILGGEYNLSILITFVSLCWASILLYKYWPINLSYIILPYMEYLFVIGILIEFGLLFLTISLRIKMGYSYINIHIIKLIKTSRRIH